MNSMDFWYGNGAEEDKKSTMHDERFNQIQYIGFAKMRIVQIANRHAATRDSSW